MESFGLILGHLVGDYIAQTDWQAKNKVSSSFACAVHCTLYTAAVWLCCFTWLPLWALPVIWAAHFPVDRWRLARKWMENVSGQREFANGPFVPWSIVIVDNVFHLIVLYAIGLFVMKAS